MPSQNLLRGGVFPLGAALACLVHNRQQLNYSLEAPKADKISKSMCTFPANNPTEDRSIYHENRTLNTRIFGVFDGHGGWNVSNFLENNMTNVLLKNLKMMECIKNDNDFSHEAHDVIIEAAMLKSFTELEESYIEKIRSAYELGFGEVARVGSCALVAVIQDNNLVVANAGDCLAVLGQEYPQGTSTAKASPILAHQINREHNARNSLERLLLTKAHPDEPDIVKCKHAHACYVKGRLQLTRAFGDLYLKSHEFNAPAGGPRSRGRHIPAPYTPPYVQYTPDIYKIKLDKSRDKFLILATDGLWDFLQPQEAVDIVAKASDPDKAADLLVEEALSRAAIEANLSLTELKSLPPGRPRRSKYDDTTVVVVYL